jgi:thiol-disulfide isomerase/thioredoxin
MCAMEKPSVFQPGSFAEAMARAKETGRWLVVDATAEWCGPCKQMDKVTWRDDGVVSWIGEHGAAIQVDVDAEQAVAKQLEIRAMPTVIAFKDGEEKDRVVGFRDPKGLLGWLRGLERGETDLDRVRQEVAASGGDMQQRLRFAQTLLQSGRRDEATDELVWLWDNIAQVEPSMTGVRLSFMARDIETLAAVHPPARERFARIRDELETSPDKRLDANARLDWVVLNGTLGDDDRTVAWHDAVKDDAAAAPALERCSLHLIELLQKRGRWADIGRLHRDPVAELARHHRITELPAAGLPEEMRAHLVEAMARHFQARAGLMVRSLRAAGRSADAEAVEREAARLDPSPEMQRALAGAPEA